MKKIGFLSQWEKIISEITTYFFKLSNKQPFFGKRRKERKVGKKVRVEEGSEGRKQRKEKRWESSFCALFIDLSIYLDFAVLGNELIALHGPGKGLPWKSLCFNLYLG